MQTNFAEPALPEVRARFGLMLGRVFRQWRREVDLTFRDDGLSDATRIPLLALYTQAEPMRQKALAEALSLDTSSLVRVLNQLRKKGLLDWCTDPSDRRAKCISLTAEGQRKAAQILRKSLQIEQAILADLSPEELNTTRQALHKISQRFDAL